MSACYNSGTLLLCYAVTLQLCHLKTNQLPVVIVGAGMAGLTCAVYLQRAGRPVVLLEAAEAPGGRVRTDEIGSFRLDRGFQILLTAYPEARRLLDYDALDLRPFRSGALIRHEPPGGAGGGWMPLLNPLREPAGLLPTLQSPIGSVADKLRLLPLLRHAQSLSLDDLFRQDAQTTANYLHDAGFSETMLTRFFRPFFGGVFLEDDLSTGSNFFEFCLLMFFSGDATVPNAGIAAIPNQLAARLLPGTLRLNAPVSRLTAGGVTLVGGEEIRADTVVLATDARQSARLLGRALPPAQAFNRTTCTYFSAPASPQPDRLLLLNPKRSSAVHNVAVMTDVAPGYGPAAAPGAAAALISVSTHGLTTVDETALTQQIQKELTGWFGPAVRQWQHLHTYHLPEALPAYRADPTRPTDPIRQPLRLADKLYQCGDHTAYPSLNAAMLTGRLVAEAIVSE
jgi:phytoene dehydrogenase-like protein